MRSLEQPGTEQDWAEGYRWLTRMVSLCQDWLLEKEDPLRPTIFRNQDEYRKLIVDNPDTNYWFASVAPEHAYRLHGNRGGAPYLGFTIGTDVMRGAPGRTGTLAQHTMDQFAVAPNGDFARSPSSSPRSCARCRATCSRSRTPARCSGRARPRTRTASSAWPARST